MVSGGSERQHQRETARREAERRQAELTKPAGSLGRLEALAVQLAGIQATPRPSARPAHALIFAADHPVAAHGVSAYPVEVTRSMLANLANGGAAASVLARRLGVPLQVVDVGVAGAPGPSGTTLRHPVAEAARGDLVHEDAMPAETCAAAIEAGREAVRALDEDMRILVLGEIGIGNTTPAAALGAALLGQPAEALVGPGTGLDPNGMARKQKLVARALERVGAGEAAPVERRLAQLGGPDLAALVGAMLETRERPCAVLVDGFSVSVAALAAVATLPELRAQLVFAHRSAEPGHARVLDALEAEPLLTLEMRLGEASGALAALPLVDAAIALHTEMATFAEAGVPDREG